MDDHRAALERPQANGSHTFIQQQTTRSRVASRWLAVVAAAALGACGGGGGGSGGGNGGPGSSSGQGSWAPGVFLPSSTFAAQCAVPRSGTPDTQGSRLTENNWLRSWSNELYLWYDEIVDRNPADYATAAYFDLLKTTQVTASGAPKDRFHFTYPTEEWIALSQSGISAGYGAEWVLLANTPPREVVVAYVQPGSPADDAGIARGARVLRVDGVDLVHADDAASVAVLNAGLFPSGVGETHELEILDLGAGSSRPVTLQSEEVTRVPVQTAATLDTQLGTVGYLLFNDHIATAEIALIEVIEELRDAGVSDLVLDLRYNGGGFLAIASQLAYMIAGPVPTDGRDFERITFNEKHPITDPVTGEPLAPMPFIDFTIGFSAEPPGEPLPTLDLERVYVITGRNTCSASESIINSLRGVGVEVVQIGSTTCGKPYGFYPTDNCGTTYFSIQFRGENHLGFGDYGDGFSPGPGPGEPDARLPGCSVADDFEHALGDPAEARFAAALHYRSSNGMCPTPSGVSRGLSKLSAAAEEEGEGTMRKGPWLTNRILDGAPTAW